MPPVAAGSVVFFASAAVLVLEILAGRLLAPYVGVTLETYTGIIGVVLAGIAAGAWYGGRLADRVNPRRLLGPLVTVGGVLALFTIPLVTFFGEALRDGGPVAILWLSLTGFFLPAAVLSAVTPTVVKLQLRDLDVTGQIVGRLSAIGTSGAILGTFLTGFVLVAAWPTRPIVIAVGLALLSGGLTLWWWLHPRDGESTAARQGSLALIGLLAVGLTWVTPSPCDEESVYYCTRVETDPNRDSGRVLVLDTLTHSYVDLDDPTYLGFGYTRIFADLLSTIRPGEPLDVLHVGGGGFTMPRWLRATRPGSTSLVLEIDPALVRIAEKRLGLRTGPDLQVRTEDARNGIRELPDAAFDVVVGDAFGGLAVPWHLTTVEFIEQVHRVLRPGGVYMINVIDRPPLDFVRAEAATLGEVFTHTAAVAPPGNLDRRDGGNFVLVASDAPLDIDGVRAAIAARQGFDEVRTAEGYEEFVGDAVTLTDDYAPVDQLLTPYR